MMSVFKQVNTTCTSIFFDLEENPKGGFFCIQKSVDNYLNLLWASQAVYV